MSSTSGGGCREAPAAATWEGAADSARRALGSVQRNGLDERPPVLQVHVLRVPLDPVDLAGERDHGGDRELFAHALGQLGFVDPRRRLIGTDTNLHPAD